MKKLKENLIRAYESERMLLVLVGINLLLAGWLFVFSVLNLRPDSSVVKIGYGDIGGYRDGAWTNMLMFPLAAILFGLIHSLLAMRIFEKRGGAMAKFFLLITMALILGAFVVMGRLLKEG